MNDSRDPRHSGIRQDPNKLRAVFDALSDGVFVCDPAGTIVDANEAACAMFAASREALVGQPLGRFSAAAEPDGQGGVPAWLGAARDGAAALFEWRCQGADGRTFWGEVGLRLTDLAGEPVALAVLRDVTERKLREERLAQEARRDPLTGLPNRHDFDDILRYEVARCERYGGYLCVALGAIDGFVGTAVPSGSQGHNATLARLAGFIRGRLRKSDYLARWGDREFALLIHDTKSDNATRMLNRMRTAIEHQAAAEFGRPVTLSFGVTGYMLSDTAEGLLGRLARALAVARQGGGNRVITT